MADKKMNVDHFRRFLNENRTLAISIPLLIILIIAVIIIYSGMGGDSVGNVVPALVENAPSDMAGNQVEVLPQTERDAGADTTAVSGDTMKSGTDVKNPFIGPITLTGIVVGDNSMAILEIGGKAIIVSEDDVLSSGLIVRSISIDKVILKDNDKNIELNLN